MIRLRPLEEAHVGDVLRVQQACYTEIVPESAASLRAKILAAPDTCFLAETEAVVGYLIAVPVVYPDLPALDAPSFQAPEQADTLYLHDLAVTQAGRGAGAGRALVGRALDAARARGFEHACLIAIQDSVPYWERFGFGTVTPPSGRVAAKLASYGASARLMRARL